MPAIGLTVQQSNEVASSDCDSWAKFLIELLPAGHCIDNEDLPRGGCSVAEEAAANATAVMGVSADQPPPATVGQPPPVPVLITYKGHCHELVATEQSCREAARPSPVEAETQEDACQTVTAGRL